MLKFGVFAYAGYCILYYYAGVLVGKVGESLWMSSVCVPKMGQLRTWMTDRSTELVPLLKIGNFPAAYVECQIGVWRKILVLCWKEITLVY